MREFETGATRNNADHKPDYEGFLSPLFVEAYAMYMHEHRFQADGKMRDSDNWQKGIPVETYIKSAWRHFVDLWFLLRGHRRYCQDDKHELNVVEVCCSLMFNIQGIAHETIKKKKEKEQVGCLWRPEDLEALKQELAKKGFVNNGTKK